MRKQPRRQGYTRHEAVAVVVQWMWENRLSQRAFLRWLSERGVMMSPGHLSRLLTYQKAPGPRFCEVFKEVTGITLMEGLVEGGADESREGTRRKTD